MINTDNQQKLEEKPVENTKKLPDESSGIYVRGHIKIHDPESGEVYIDKPNAIQQRFGRALSFALREKNYDALCADGRAE